MEKFGVPLGSKSKVVLDLHWVALNYGDCHFPKTLNSKQRTLDGIVVLVA